MRRDGRLCWGPFLGPLGVLCIVTALILCSVDLRAPSGDQGADENSARFVRRLDILAGRTGQRIIAAVPEAVGDWGKGPQGEESVESIDQIAKQVGGRKDVRKDGVTVVCVPQACWRLPPYAPSESGRKILAFAHLLAPEQRVQLLRGEHIGLRELTGPQWQAVTELFPKDRQSLVDGRDEGDLAFGFCPRLLLHDASGQVIDPDGRIDVRFVQQRVSEDLRLGGPFPGPGDRSAKPHGE